MNAVEKLKTYISYSTTPYRKSCRLWDNVKISGGARGRKWQHGGALHAELVRLHARKHTPASVHPQPHTHTHTHTDYVILIAFPRQQRFRERAWMLRYTYIACLVPFGGWVVDILLLDCI